MGTAPFLIKLQARFGFGGDMVFFHPLFEAKENRKTLRRACTPPSFGTLAHRKSVCPHSRPRCCGDPMVGTESGDCIEACFLFSSLLGRPPRRTCFVPTWRRAWNGLPGLVWRLCPERDWGRGWRFRAIGRRFEPVTARTNEFVSLSPALAFAPTHGCLDACLQARLWGNHFMVEPLPRFRPTSSEPRWLDCERNPPSINSLARNGRASLLAERRAVTHNGRHSAAVCHFGGDPR